MNAQPPDYDVLEIRLTPGPDAYNVQIRAASGARAHGQFDAPTQSKVEAIRRTLDPRNPVRGPAPKLEAAKEFGAQLFRLLVETPGVRDVYTAARNTADAAKRGLRVTLSLGAVPDLASIPWEFLYDHPRFLALHNSPVVRFVDLKDPWPPPQVKPPLRILGMVSRPKDGALAALDAEGEQVALEQRLGPLIASGHVTLRWLERATLRALQQEVDHGEDFHVFHYIGHGEYDDESGHSSLLLEHNDGRSRHVGGLELGQILCRHRGSLRLAVLNACDAAQTAPQDPMAGVATSLMEHGVPAVVAMQFAITDDGALTFADEFYRALAAGRDVDAAVTQARCTLAVDTGLEWGTPVLFMRVADGRLFDLRSTAQPPVSLSATPKTRRFARPLPTPTPTPTPTSRIPLGLRGRIAVGAIVLALGAISVFVVLAARTPTLTIYSSWPQHEQPDRALEPPPDDERTRDMQDGARLALEQAGGRAGDFKVRYMPLDSSDAAGETTTASVQANARRAVDDDRAAAYLGDFTSDATQVSIPMLSRGGVPQIAVSATRNGLTRTDPLGDKGEPEIYYPTGYRNFVRIIPRTWIHARAMVAVMLGDGCTTVAMIHDNTRYGRGLANDLREYNRRLKRGRRLRFAFSQPVEAREFFDQHIAQARGRTRRPDCFVYSGVPRPNTADIFAAFADALAPKARLYGTNGLAAASFYDHRSKRGLPAAIAPEVTIMVPPRDIRATAAFDEKFKERYDRDPDPYTVYAYEAMRLALYAINRSKTGDRADIRDELFETPVRQGPLGAYSIDDKGDTSITSYGFSMIDDGRLTPPRTAPR